MAMNLPGSWSVVCARVVLRDHAPMLMQTAGIDIDALNDDEIVRLYRDLFRTERPQDAPTSKEQTG